MIVPVGVLAAVLVGASDPAVPPRRAARPAQILNACAGAVQPDYWFGQLRSADPAVRAKAARALGEMRDAAAVPALIEALNDQNHGVRLSAVRALGRIGPAAGAALPALTGLLTDPDVILSAEAAKSVEKIRSPR